MGMRGSFSGKIHVCPCGTKIGAFSEIGRRRFLPNNKDANSPLKRGALRIPVPPHIEKPQGWGTLRVWVCAAEIRHVSQ